MCLNLYGLLVVETTTFERISEPQFSKLIWKRSHRRYTIILIHPALCLSQCRWIQVIYHLLQLQCSVFTGSSHTRIFLLHTKLFSSYSFNGEVVFLSEISQATSFVPSHQHYTWSNITFITGDDIFGGQGPWGRLLFESLSQHRSSYNYLQPLTIPL